MPGLFVCLSKRETELSTINGKYLDFLQANNQLEFRNASLRGQVDRETEVKQDFSQKLAAQEAWFDEPMTSLDARLIKMDKEYEEELAPAMRDVVRTKKWVVGKDFHYLLDKFKESDILNASIGSLLSGTIFDGIRQALEARTVHGRKGTDINAILAYNPDAAYVYSDTLNALNDAPCPLLKSLEAYADKNLSNLQAFLVIGTDES
ncbi:hypothetical protein Tco_0637596 [Tanacetum coccineum]